MTGTGWPTDEAHDLDFFHFLILACETYDDDKVTAQVRDILGLPKGTPFTDALPFTREKRERLTELLALDLSVYPDSFRFHALRQLAQAARERRDQQVDAVGGPGRTCLYRFLDDVGRLLYVGVSWDPDIRETQHRASQRWAPLIARREDEWFSTRVEALRAESAAIRDESPLFNEAGRPRLPYLPEDVA